MTTYIKVEKEEKEKYKGSWPRLPELNRKIQSTLRKRNKLAAHIINGNIKVEKKETLFGYIYQCAAVVLTHFLLAMMVIMAADQKTMKAEVKKRIFNTKEKEYYTYIIDIAKSKMDDNEKAQSIFGVNTDKSIKQPTQLTEKEIREAIAFFAEYEDEKETNKRFKDGKLTTQEFLDTNMISGTTEEKKKFYFTGLVPKALINAAMTEIDNVINELVDANLLKDTRFLNADKSRSTTGMLVKVKNIVVFSKSRLQQMTAKSSTEAEIIALCDFVEEVMWIKYLLTDFDIYVTPEIFCDNKPAIQTIERGQLARGNKHIVRRMHFTKGYVDEGEITLSHIRSEDNESDILTKALPKTTYQKICKNIFDL